MILLDEALESPSEIWAPRPVNTKHSRQLQPNQRAARRSVESLAQRGVPSDGALAARHDSLHKTASNDPAIAMPCAVTAEDKKTSPIARRRQVTTTGLAVLATGALVGIIWSANEIGPSSESAAMATNTAQSATTQPALQEILVEAASPPASSQSHIQASAEAIPAPAAANPVTDKQAALPAIDTIIEELTETRRLADEYLEEIDWLHTQNYSLNRTIDDLNSETTALNYELLQLEMKVITLEADAKPKIEKRTVYNFVNVPIGSASE